MKIALAQINFTIGDIDGNSLKIVESIDRAKKSGARLVVFSELSITGYYPHDMLERSEFVERSMAAIQSIALQCTEIAALVGGPAVNRDGRGKQLYNAAWFLADGEVKEVFYKTLLPTYDVFDEYRHFEPNNTFRILEYEGYRIAVTICEDIWDEQPAFSDFGKDSLYRTSPLEELQPHSPNLLVNLSASPFSHTQEQWRKQILLAKAEKYHLPLIYVNQIGAHAEMIFDGGSLFVQADGTIARELAYFKEDFAVVDLSDNAEPNVAESFDTIQKIHDALVLGISDYFRKSGFTSATLGLSGGIDSAVVAALATEALGSDNVHGLLMPSAYSSRHSVDDAIDLARNLKIGYHLVSIEKSFDTVVEAMQPVFGARPPDVTEENIQARIRGVLVMALSNKMGHIVLNTTNKSEAAVGYGTLYGDMNGGLAVLGDVYKTDVYRLAAYINRNRELIPHNSIVKPPSAELRPGQMDSDSLPDYTTLDAILFQYIELNHSADDIVALGYDREVVRRMISLVDRNEYKRFQAAPILRVSSKAFGFGRRMPLVARY